MHCARFCEMIKKWNGPWTQEAHGLAEQKETKLHQYTEADVWHIQPITEQRCNLHRVKEAYTEDSALE